MKMCACPPRGSAGPSAGRRPQRSGGRWRRLDSDSADGGGVRGLGKSAKYSDFKKSQNYFPMKLNFCNFASKDFDVFKIFPNTRQK